MIGIVIGIKMFVIVFLLLNLLNSMMCYFLFGRFGSGMLCGY